MNEAMRERAKENFPMVLLTLLSIVQALALELLWAHVVQTDYLLQLSPTMAIAWLQVIATFLGIVLIWVIYASNVMRFRWVPATTDSVFPFLIGILEFLLVETLGPENLGQWFIFMGLVFAVMNWTAQVTMRRARMDADNQAFFRGIAPASWRDFLPETITVGSLIAVGMFFWASRDYGTVALLALLATFSLLIWQYIQTAKFWNRSIAARD